VREEVLRKIRASFPDLLLILVSHDTLDRNLVDRTVEFAPPDRGIPNRPNVTSTAICTDEWEPVRPRGDLTPQGPKTFF
jgi:hypothetical protein